jgi:hypothetical protein
VLPDTMYANLFLDNISITLTNIIELTTTLYTEPYNFSFQSINNYLVFLQLWPTDYQFSNSCKNILPMLYTDGINLKLIQHILDLDYSFYLVDYVYGFALKNIFYSAYLTYSIDSNLVVIKPLVFSLNFSVVFLVIFNKWSYFVMGVFVCYMLSNILGLRFQYGLNFYFTYFKTLADLGEQEYGSYDDYKFFLFLLAQLFLWYCWVFFIIYTASVQSESRLVLLTLSVMIIILTIPVRLLWDFGLAFGMYVRGAASSSNMIVEAFFDVIGVIIIFTRFVVQNIRFLLVFVAYFELFEWSSMSLDSYYIAQINNPFNYIANGVKFDAMSIFAVIIVFIKGGLIYLYHLLHLIIVSFMQIGVYLMVSFWLFFFLYTSFFKLTSDSYFYIRRNN